MTTKLEQTVEESLQPEAVTQIVEESQKFFSVKDEYAYRPKVYLIKGQIRSKEEALNAIHHLKLEPLSGVKDLRLSFAGSSGTAFSEGNTASLARAVGSEPALEVVSRGVVHSIVSFQDGSHSIVGVLEVDGSKKLMTILNNVTVARVVYEDSYDESLLDEIIELRADYAIPWREVSF